jgi:hypothetical protein
MGGGFSTVNGVARPRLAAVATTNSAVSSWTPAPDGAVLAIAPQSSSAYYFGGNFTTLQGATRSHIALERPATALLSPWAPEPDGGVNAIASAGSMVIVGGSFRRFGGLPQGSLAGFIQSSAVDVPPSHAGASLSMSLSPNPSVGRVRLAYTLPAAAHVRIGIFDVLGRRVAQPVDGVQASGPHEFDWNTAASGVSLAPGLYLIRVEAGSLHAERRCVIMR